MVAMQEVTRIFLRHHYGISKIAFLSFVTPKTPEAYALL